VVRVAAPGILWLLARVPMRLILLTTLLFACRSTKTDDTGADNNQGGDAGDAGDDGADDGGDNTPVDADGDGVTADDDCDDGDADVFPGADEVCNGVDDDCDGATDEDLGSMWFADVDGDGFGDPATGAQACDAPSGTVADNTDCDDTNPQAAPDQVEVCDEVDNNCDGEVDEGVTTSFYADVDGDGYGVSSSVVEACSLPDGFAAEAGDCDDTDGDVWPGTSESCDGIDNNCDGTIDEATALDASTWFSDTDTDGYGDPTTGTVACDMPSDTVLDSTDCDDTNAAVNPGATEVCNAIDDDCDALIDDDDSDLDPSTATSWYADTDSDGYGDASAVTVVCDMPSGTVLDATDCDDSESAVNPGATEVCNLVDDDCDGLIDDADSDLDASTATSWYADADSDGYGDPAVETVACAAPSSTVSDSSDCDDTDGAVSPSATEVWYDGVDQDCAGDDDDDADGDGDTALAAGGGDCDDNDASVYLGVGCRPVSTCTRPSATTLASSDPSGISDIVFDDSCLAYVCTLISGTDYVYTIDSSGANTVYTGASNHNMGSVALDPVTGAVVVGYNNVNYIGYSSGTTLPVIATSSAVSGGTWTNGYLRGSPSSIAMDTNGCIWVPNFDASGSLVCVETDGTETTLVSGLSYVESVALDSGDEVYVSIGTSIYHIDGSGTMTTEWTGADTVMDFTFDYNDDIYVETDDGLLTRVPSDGSADELFATVTGQAKLAISPDGWLVRVIPAPVGAASYEEFALD
jgi:hypothetical protein